MSNLVEYPVDVDAFKKRLILRTFSIFLINLTLLGWTVFSAPRESLLNYAAICLIVIVAIALFLYQNFKRQVTILKNNYLEVNNHILQWYTGTGTCTTINLKRVEKIERDKFRGFDRFIVFEGDTPYSILNLKSPDEFQKQIETFTNLKTEIFEIDWKKRILKTIGFFLPACIGFLVSYLNFLDIRFFFLVLTVNSIFFLVQFSEKRTRDGFSESTVRRSSIILFLLLAYQILILIGSNP